MSKSPFDANPAFAKLGEEARKSVGQAFDAMADWRKDLANMGEKNSNMVFDKMSDAAKALGWPTDFVELSRKQMQSATQMQVQAIDQVMDIWEKQLSSFGSMPDMSKFPSMPTFPVMPTFPGMPSASAFPGFQDMTASPMAPMQMWMQAAEMWQKNWQQAMSTWMDAQAKMMNKSGGPGSKF